MTSPLHWCLAVLSCALLACPKPAANAEDPLVQKLKAEADRLAQQEQARASEPGSQLAELVGKTTPVEGRRPLPDPNPTVHAGTVALKLFEVSAHHSVQGGGRLTLTSEDFFLRVVLLAQNVGPKPQVLNLGGATVEHGEQSIPLARDVQRLAGTRELDREYPPDERVELVMYFEVPAEALSGLTLVLPPAGAGGSDTRIRLE